MGGGWERCWTWPQDNQRSYMCKLWCSISISDLFDRATQPSINGIRSDIGLIGDQSPLSLLVVSC